MIYALLEREGDKVKLVKGRGGGEGGATMERTAEGVKGGSEREREGK